MARYLVTDIEYDTDGEDSAGLPRTLEVATGEDPADAVAGEVSALTGWCVISCNYAEIPA